MNNYYTIIPAEVRFCEDLSSSEILFYGDISSLTNDKGYCFASNDFMSEKFNVSKKTISTWISKLEKLGFIKSTLIYKENSKQVKERRIYINQKNSKPDVAEVVEVEKPKPKVIKDTKNDVDILFEELKEIFYKHYPSATNKLTTKQTKEKLKNLVSKQKEIKIGLDNYLKFNKKNNTEVKYIKGLAVFLNQEVYLDYQQTSQENKPEIKRGSNYILDANGRIDPSIFE